MLHNQRSGVACFDRDNNLLRPDAAWCSNGRCPNEDAARDNVRKQGVCDGDGESSVAAVGDVEKIDGLGATRRRRDAAAFAEIVCFIAMFRPTGEV